MAKSVSKEELDSFHKDGYLIIRDLMTPAQTQSLRIWAQQVHDWVPTPDSQFMPYEVLTSIGSYCLDAHCFLGSQRSR